MNQTKVEWTQTFGNPISKDDILKHKHTHTHVSSEITDLDEKLKILNILTSLRGKPSYSIENKNGSVTDQSSSGNLDYFVRGTGASPHGSCYITYSFPRTLLAIDKTTGYYLVNGIAVQLYACLDNGAQSVYFQFTNTKLDLVNNTVSNLLYSQVGLTHNQTSFGNLPTATTLPSVYINNSWCYSYEQGYHDGDYNFRKLYAKFYYDENNIYFYALADAYGEENDHADTHIRISDPSLISLQYVNS